MIVRNINSTGLRSKTSNGRAACRARTLSLLLVLALVVLWSTPVQSQNFWMQTSGPAGGTVNHMARDTSGVLWAAVNNQLFISTTNGAQWQRFVNKVTFGTIWSITATNSGDVLLGASGGLWRIKNRAAASFLAIAIGVRFISAHETSSGALLAGGSRGGVWRSNTDSTWAQVLPRGASWDITAIEGSGSSLYAASNWPGSARGGIFKSTNDGVNWQHSDTTLTNTGVTALAIDRKGHVYAGTGSGPEGISVTHDGGQTWAAMNTGLSNTLVNAVATPDSSTVFAGTRNGVFLTHDYGDSWSEAGEGMNGRLVWNLTPGRNSMMFAGTGTGVFRSANAGAPWVASNGGLIASRVTKLAINSNRDVLASANGLQQSRDGGETWQMVLEDVGINDVSAKDNSTIFVASDQGMFRSVDAGMNWLPINSGLTLQRLEAVDVSPDGKTVVAGSFINFGDSGQPRATQLDYLFRSEDRGDSWKPVDHGFIINSVNEIVFKNDSLVFLLPFESEMFRSADKGRNWQRIPKDFPGRILDLAINSGGDLYAVTRGGTFFSKNDGNTWTELLNGDASVQAISIAINSRNEIFVVNPNGSVDVSRDDGGSWQSLTAGISTEIVETIALDHLGLLYAGTSSAGVFRSGESTAPVAVLTVSADSLDFGSVPIGDTGRGTLLFGNAGNATLTISQAKITGPDSADFEIVGGGRFPAISPGASVLRLFNLKSIQPRSLLALLVLESNAASSPDTVVLRGFGASKLLVATSPALDFGTVRLGTDSTQTFYLKNTGNATIQIDSVANAGSQFRFNASLPLPVEIGAGDSLAATVTFVPDTVELSADTLRFRNDSHNAAPELTIPLSGAGGVGLLALNPESRDYGSIAIGDHTDATFTLDNPGQLPVVISRFELGQKGFSFVSPRATPFSIPAGSAATVTVRFLPDSNRVFVEVLKIFNDARNQSPFATIPLTGTGLLRDLDVQPDRLDFGPVTVGLQRELAVTIQNQAPFSIEIDSTTISGQDSMDFVVQSGAGPVAIASGQSHSIAIRFSPDRSGTRMAVLEISCPNPAKDPVDIPLFGEALNFEPILPVEIAVGKELVVTVARPVDFLPVQRKLFYRMAGQTSYSSADLAAEDSTFFGLVPAETVTLRGVEYYVSLTNDVGQTLTFPGTTPETSPATARVAVPQLDSPLQFEPAVYKMISVPASLHTPAIDSVLFDDFGEYDPDLWKFLRWRDSTATEMAGYLELPGMDSSFTFEAGRAYWITSRFGAGFDIDDARSTDSGEDYTIRLGPGWNQIGNPFLFPVAWSDVENRELLQTPQFYLGTDTSNPDSLFSDVTVLQPWEGYFVYNNSRDSLSILVPPKEYTATEPDSDSRPAASGYTLRLAVQSRSGMKDKNNYVGLKAKAESGIDQFDRFEPPAIGNFVSLSVVEAGREFNASFKPIAAAGQIWVLQLTSSKSKDEVEIELLETGVLPAGFVRHVLDMEYETAVSVDNSSFRIKLGQAFSKRELRLLIGTQAFSEANSDGVPLIPVQFILRQNYPNPFNPETTIEYQVDKRGPVRLTIYNLLGQEVRVLVRTEQSPGPQVALWDGKNGSGQPAASGVYLYRLRVGEKTATRKLALIR